MTAPRMVSARELIGRRIVGFEPDAHPGEGSGGFTAHLSPSIRLDDGSVLTFMAEELENGDGYGIWIGRVIPPRRHR
jgi:hypothetical protein